MSPAECRTGWHKPGGQRIRPESLTLVTFWHQGSLAPPQLPDRHGELRAVSGESKDSVMLARKRHTC